MTDTTIERDAHCIASQVLAIEVQHRRLRHAPCDIRDIEVTVALDKIVRQLRTRGVAKRAEDPSEPMPRSNGRNGSRPHRRGARHARR